MSIIKIRVWDGEQMVSPDYIDRNGAGWWKEHSIPTTSKKTMLFIGEKDKYGTDIYEEDIVQAPKRAYLYGRTGIVKVNLPNIYIEEIKTARQREVFYSYDGEEFTWNQLKVIGNTYANPELANCGGQQT